MSSYTTPPGWYPDGDGWERRWDGDGWTEDRRKVAPDTPPPARVFASIGLTPAATTRTSTSLSTGEGVGMVAGCSTPGSPTASKTAALISAGIAGGSSRTIWGDDRSGRNLT